jgi:hypothetical protein
MDFSRELMDQVYDDPNSALCQWSKYVWSTFCYWNHLIGQGCADDQASRDEHAEAVRVQAERFMRAFLLRCLPKHVTVYMHIMQCHCHELIEVHGSLDKFSSQGAEAIHQETRFAALKRSNKHLDSVAEQTFCFVRLYQDLIAQKGYPKKWLKPRQLSAGRSKACAEINEATIADAKQQMENFGVEHDEDLLRLLLLEDAMLDGDDRHKQQSEGGPDTESEDDSDSDSDDEIDAQPPSGTVGFLDVHA